MSQNPNAPNTRLTGQFPRGTELPSQSPLFWVSQKDRYLRQLLIQDIEQATGRRLIVYYTDCYTSGSIDPSDPKYISELVQDVQGQDFDLLLETNGGQTDATEAVVSLLLKASNSFRVIVPYRAKSNGTLIALAGSKIVLGPQSELGPIDPHLVIQNQMVPCWFIVNAPGQVDPITFQYAQHAIEQTRGLARNLLEQGMMSGTPVDRIEEVVNKLSTREHYHSHGSVIDHGEAETLGLAVEKLAQDDEVWKRIWLLRCMLEHDARKENYTKLFETVRLSHAILNL